MSSSLATPAGHTRILNVQRLQPGCARGCSCWSRGGGCSRVRGAGAAPVLQPLLLVRHPCKHGEAAAAHHGSVGRHVSVCGRREVVRHGKGAYLPEREARGRRRGRPRASGSRALRVPAPTSASSSLLPACPPARRSGRCVHLQWRGTPVSARRPWPTWGGATTHCLVVGRTVLCLQRGYLRGHDIPGRQLWRWIVRDVRWRRGRHSHAGRYRPGTRPGAVTGEQHCSPHGAASFVLPGTAITDAQSWSPTDETKAGCS